MKKTILLALAASFLFGCNLQRFADKSGKVDDTTEKSTAANTGNTSKSAETRDAEAQKILGSYVGPFGDNKITLLITKVSDGAISGRSIVGGNDRPFDGTYTVDSGNYVIAAREPGDHKDDGVFTFSIYSDKPDQVNGTWKANDTKRPEKSFSLQRRSFEYRANVGTYPQASTRVLRTADVENLPKEELEFMRNEIFARHGYCFNRKDLRQMFEKASWYVPQTVDIKGYLTDIEKKNIALIKRYEKYAEEYGDEYGR